MPQTVQYLEGDGTSDDFLNITLMLPDTGSSIVVAGTVRTAGSQLVSVATTTLGAPAPPTLGTIWFNVQVDSATGVATLQQSPSAPPAPLSGTARIVFSQAITATSTDLALAGNDSTPDPPVGSA